MRREVFYLSWVFTWLMVFAFTNSNAQTLPNLSYKKLLKNNSYKSIINDTLIVEGIENNNKESSTHSTILEFNTEFDKNKSIIIATHTLKKYSLLQYTLLSNGQKEMKEFPSSLNGAALAYHYDKKGNFMFVADTLTSYIDAKTEHEAFLKSTQRILPLGTKTNSIWKEGKYKDTLTQNITIINGLNIEFRYPVTYWLQVDSLHPDAYKIIYHSDKIKIEAIDSRLSAQGFDLNINGTGKISGTLFYDKKTYELKEATENAKFDCNYEMKTPSRNIKIPVLYNYSIKTEQTNPW